MHLAIALTAMQHRKSQCSVTADTNWWPGWMNATDITETIIIHGKATMYTRIIRDNLLLFA